MKNVRRMYIKTKFENIRWHRKEEKKLVCYNCRTPGHVIAECLENKNKSFTSKKPYKKKDLIATWDTESESEEDVDTANMCFMANENIP